MSNARPTGPLLVIVEEKLSTLLSKGELTPRYYNPGGVFDEVHILTINDDKPDLSRLQTTVGDARLVHHNLPAPSRMVLRSALWRVGALRAFVRASMALARKIRPALIRVHANHVGAFAASRIKRELGVPYVVSLHLNPDEDWGGPRAPLRSRVALRLYRSMWRESLVRADRVLPVYEPIVPHLRALGVSRYEVAYNVINPTNLVEKADYALHHPPRVISVGRQFADKDPSNLIRAVATLAGVRLTLVGDGAYHERLVALTKELGLDDRVTFHRAVPNADLCVMLAEHDVFATHTDYWEVNKSVLEALLTGLPVLLNRRRGEPVPELAAGLVMFCENSPNGYAAALRELLEVEGVRASLGSYAKAHARKRWDPSITEENFARIYRDVMLA